MNADQELDERLEEIFERAREFAERCEWERVWDLIDVSGIPLALDTRVGRAIRFCPDPPAAAQDLVGYVRRLESAAPKDPRSLRRLAAAEAARGNRPAALVASRAAVELAPDDPVSLELLTRCARELGVRTEAEAAVARLRELEPEGATLLALEALLTSDLGNLRLAAELAARAYFAGSREPELSRILGDFLATEGDAEGAANAYIGASALDPWPTKDLFERSVGAYEKLQLERIRRNLPSIILACAAAGAATFAVAYALAHLLVSQTIAWLLAGVPATVAVLVSLGVIGSHLMSDIPPDLQDLVRAQKGALGLPRLRVLKTLFLLYVAAWLGGTALFAYHHRELPALMATVGWPLVGLVLGYLFYLKRRRERRTSILSRDDSDGPR